MLGFGDAARKAASNVSRNIDRMTERGKGKKKKVHYEYSESEKKKHLEIAKRVKSVKKSKRKGSDITGLAVVAILIALFLVVVIWFLIRMA